MAKQQKFLAFLDVDNTLYDGYSTSDFYLFCRGNGLGGTWVQQRHDQLVSDYASGKITYDESVIAAVQLTADVVKDNPVEIVQELAKEMLKTNNRIFAYASDLVQVIRENNGKVYLISAGSNPNIEEIGRSLGVDRIIASKLDQKAGKYTGKIGEVLTETHKQQRILDIIKEYPDQIFKVGIGDSSGDIGMFELMDSVLIVNAHQESLRTQARERNWRVVDSIGIVDELKAILRDLL